MEKLFDEIPTTKLEEIKKNEKGYFKFSYRWEFNTFQIGDKVKGIRIDNRMDEARKTSARLSKKYDLCIANMPMIIDVLKEAYSRMGSIDLSLTSNSLECQGLRKNKFFYEVWHSAGSISTAKGLMKIIYNQNDDRSFNIPESEWESMGKGVFGRETIERVHIQDLKKGQVPSERTPYTVYTPIPEDYQLIPLGKSLKKLLPKIKKNELIIFEPGKLNYEQFMIDDRIAAICGSLENVEALARIRFRSRKINESGMTGTISSKHYIDKGCLGNKPTGRFLKTNKNCLDSAGDHFLIHQNYLLLNGKMKYDINY